MNRLRYWKNTGLNRLWQFAAKAVQACRQRKLCVCAVFLYLIICFLCLAGHDFLPASPGEEVTKLRRQLLAGDEIEELVSGTIVRTEWTESGRKLLLKDLQIGQITENPKVRMWVTLPEETDARKNRTLLRGLKVRLKGIVYCSPQPGNPGQFDSRTHDLAGNVLYRMKKITLNGIAGMASPLAMADLLRERAARILCETAGDDAGIIRAMLLGDRSDLESEVRNIFSDGGISHILAVSGLHISIFGMGLFQVLRKRNASYAVCCTVSGMAVMLYCFLTGMSVSAFRAMIMYMVWAGSQAAGRTNDMLTSAAAAASVVLLLHPVNVKEAGFYLSFGCILSIILVCPRLKAAGEYAADLLIKMPNRRILNRKMLSRKTPNQKNPNGETPNGKTPSGKTPSGKTPNGKTPDQTGQEKGPSGGGLLKILVDSVSLSLGILLGTLPLSAWFFYQFSPWSVLTNLIVIPLMPAVMLSGLGAAITGIFFPAAGIFLFSPCHYLLKLFFALAGFMNRLPGALIITGRPAWWKVPFYYLLLAAGLWGSTGLVLGKAVKGGKAEEAEEAGKNTGKTAAAARSLFLISAAVFFLCHSIPPSFQITFLDVGQGDCILLQTGRRSFLVDCGSSSVTDVWNFRVKSTLKYYGIRTLDRIFLTHGDVDHTNGIRQMLDDGNKTLTGVFRSSGIRTTQICTARDAPAYDNALKEVIDLASGKGIPVAQISQGDRILCGKMSLECLWPGGASPGTGMSGADWKRLAGNETSLVFLVEYKNERILLTGDLEKEGEEMFLEYWKNRTYRDTDPDHIRSGSNMPGSNLPESSLAESSLAGSSLAGSDLMLSSAPVTLLKVGHHGSRSATSKEMLKVLCPRLALISCGKNNLYGHPSQEVLERLHTAGCGVWRTDQQGALIVR